MFIHDGKRYDPETADKLYDSGEYWETNAHGVRTLRRYQNTQLTRVLYRTKKGAYFAYRWYGLQGTYKVLTFEQAKVWVGEYCPQLYEEIFGVAVEDA